ncbi:glycosyltransferase [Candidatus Woesearchaeota archaeon]|nr:glycosyltransferase [Candidatus Woesearchaeota archaeon]
MISIIIRSKNEEAWIKRCLSALKHQKEKNFEIILVDNESNDRTAEIAKEFGCQIVNLPSNDFNYSKALNIGIENSKGDFVICLSAHCIPSGPLWLTNLIKNFQRPDVAAVYGKQEPLPESNMFDKRDLWMLFGDEKRIQHKAHFFDNANSAIRRTVWEQFRFNENINGKEDWDFARKILEKGHKIVYEPNASVHHYHGINQARDEKRCERVVKIIELLNEGNKNGK